jgi:hypothetical protein
MAVSATVPLGRGMAVPGTATEPGPGAPYGGPGAYTSYP